METRSATQADLPSIMALSKTTPWERSDFLKRQVALRHVIVASEHEAILGLIVCNREFFEKPFVWLVIVSDSRRREGIGARLFAAIEADNSGNRIYTSANRSNGAVAAFLAHRGYRVIGEIDLDPGDSEVFYAGDF
jgi:GNAT superfamily N-acetyltransferase